MLRFSRTRAGIQKHDSLSKFFDSVLDGTADLSALNRAAAAEEFVPDEKELEIERMQEAQRIALAHGGFTDLIDFEEALKNGAGADFHEKHGYPGMMGGGMPKKAKEGAEKETDEEKGEKKEEEDILRKMLKASQEAERKEREQPKMAKTGDAGQVVLEAKETGHPRTGGGAPAASSSPEAEEVPVAEEATPSPAPASAAEPVVAAEATTKAHASDEL